MIHPSASSQMFRLCLLPLALLAACGDGHSRSAPDGGLPPEADGGLPPGPDGGAPDGAGPTAKPKVKLLVFSDPHYMDPSLGRSGPAFDAYLAGDRKLLAESDAIMRAMLAEVEAQNPQVVLVSGDLTKDGELVSHQSAAAYLRRMEAGGRRVFVVPGNHDIEKSDAESYLGDTPVDVPTVSAAEFAAIYADFGFSGAVARDPGSLSYVAELCPGLWLLALDSCIYGDTRGSSETGGRFLDPTRAWIQAQLDLARAQGIRVVAMMHHGLVEHFSGQSVLFGAFLVSDRDAVGALLSNGGVGAVFTGHFHAHDITQWKPIGAERSVVDIETGSTVTYPSAYRIVDVDGDVLTVATRHVAAIDYDLKGAPDFQSYARDRLRLGLEELITRILTSPTYQISPEDAAQIAPFLGDGLLVHYVGDEVMTPDVLVEAQALKATGSLYKALAGTMLQSIYTDLPPADNDVVIDLAAR
jgi:3',5'-cyclic AMP phosphodiesterase CpdA